MLMFPRLRSEWSAKIAGSTTRSCPLQIQRWCGTPTEEFKPNLQTTFLHLDKTTHIIWCRFNISVDCYVKESKSGTQIISGRWKWLMAKLALTSVLHLKRATKNRMAGSRLSLVDSFVQRRSWTHFCDQWNCKGTTLSLLFVLLKRCL